MKTFQKSVNNSKKYLKWINFSKNKIPISNIPMNNLLGPHIQRQSLWSILIINEDIRNFPISFNQVLAFSTSNVIKY